MLTKEREQFFKWLFVWGLLFFVAILLRQFFLLFFLTFVFAFVQESLCIKAQNFLPARRRLRVSMLGAGVLFALLMIAYLGAPRVKEEAAQFIRSMPTYINGINAAMSTMSPFVYKLVGFTEPPTIETIWILLGSEQSFLDVSHLMTGLINSMVSVISSLFLAFLFSFLILFDLDSLRASLIRLSSSRASFIYQVLAPSLSRFGAVLGEALQAQLIIAILNTCLTAIGVLLLGLENKLFILSTVVFLCSFIPIAGVFISSAPITIIALQAGGFSLAAIAAGYIMIIHAIEAYILNPQIYGHQLKMNPVVSLILLTLAGKMLGVWGLVLVLPIATYVAREIIFRKEES